ncbi:DUF523 and DUF1722 domain-containing protein [Oceanicoccus sp. KOV_DT_Chl]|uniref:YbgA family protein n=1 Tax=Oceanicoccus sp. KOV_DT_Chl TaxID=1904639 RepID=UPI000C7B38D4|nr:DUF523 and DUF1722 domain-containing protein [Oceanicoccus sp. KOV_DT_Chl]
MTHTSSKPVIGIGACLVGQPVRYNGDSKRQNPHIEALKNHLQFNSFCPEVAIGLGVPRETIRLVGELATVQLMDSNTQSIDYSEPMKNYAAKISKQHGDLAGYILVKGSPSCGYDRVKRYNQQGNVAGHDAMGLFAQALQQKDPLLPMEEDGRLHDPALRENFISRVYAYHDWKQCINNGVSHRQLIEFWARYKYLVMAHHISNYQKIGRLLANNNYQSIDQLAAEFIHLLMQSLTVLASRKSRSNVLEHIRGYLKKQLDSNDKNELSQLINQYRDGTVPLIVPLTLLRHHFKHHHHSYIDQQVFFHPYPEQLSLRNTL